jgi:hypothetical protein
MFGASLMNSCEPGIKLQASKAAKQSATILQLLEHIENNWFYFLVQQLL